MTDKLFRGGSIQSCKRHIQAHARFSMPEQHCHAKQQAVTVNSRCHRVIKQCKVQEAGYI